MNKGYQECILIQIMINRYPVTMILNRRPVITKFGGAVPGNFKMYPIADNPLNDNIF